MPQSATDFETAARAAIALQPSPLTREDYERTLTAWLAHCDEECIAPEDPPPDAAASYREMLGRDLVPASVRHKLATLSSVYGALSAWRPPIAAWNPFNPRILPWPPAPTQGKTEAVDEDVAERMIEAAERDDALRDAAILRILYDTGLRRMSVASLRRDRLVRRDGRLVARVVVKGSGGEEEEVALTDAAARSLERWLEVAPKSPHAFPARGRRGGVDVSTVNRIVVRWAEAVGAEGVHPHCFRTAFITTGFDAGQHWRDVQVSVHHRDPRSTQRYDRGQRGQGVADAVSRFRQKKSDK